MKNPILLVALTLFSIGICLSQSQVEKRDIVTVYLKKGMIIHGKIIKVSPGESITIQNNHGDTVFIRDSQIKKYQVADPTVVAIDIKSTYDFRETGFYQASTFGVILNTVSVKDGGLVGFEMTAAAGYLTSRLFGLGAGIGADFYHRGAGEMIFPLFLEMRGYLMQQPSSPYYVVRTGYGFAFKNEDLGISAANGGWMLNPAIGWRMGDGRGLKMTMDLGFKFQKATFDYRSGGERSTAELLYKRLNLRLGFLF